MKREHLVILLLSLLACSIKGDVKPILECYERDLNTFIAYLGHSADASVVVSSPDLLDGVTRTGRYYDNGRIPFSQGSYNFKREFTWSLTTARLVVDPTDKAHLCPRYFRIVVRGSNVVNSLINQRGFFATQFGVSQEEVFITNTLNSVQILVSSPYPTFLAYKALVLWYTNQNSRYSSTFWTNNFGITPTPTSAGEYFTILSTGVEEVGAVIPVVSYCKLPLQLNTINVCDEKGNPVLNIVTPTVFNGDVNFFPNTVIKVTDTLTISGHVNLSKNPQVDIRRPVRLINGVEYYGGIVQVSSGGSLTVSGNFYHADNSYFVVYPGSYVEVANYTARDSKIYISKRATFIAYNFDITGSTLYLGLNSNFKILQCLSASQSKLVLDVSQLDAETLDKQERKVISYTCKNSEFTSVSVNPDADVCITTSTNYKPDGLYVTFQVVSKNRKCSETSGINSSSSIVLSILLVIGMLFAL